MARRPRFFYLRGCGAGILACFSHVVKTSPIAAIALIRAG
jgi:hypothetical protein